MGLRIRRDEAVGSQGGLEYIRYRSGTYKAKLLQAHAESPLGLTDEEAGKVTGLYQARAEYWPRCGEMRDAGLIEFIDEYRRGDSGVLRQVSRITAYGAECAGRA